MNDTDYPDQNIIELDVCMVCTNLIQDCTCQFPDGEPQVHEDEKDND